MTYLYEKYDESLFMQRVENYDRMNQFGYDGWRALYEWLAQHSDNTGPIEIDIIALCCEFTRYESLEEFNADCGRRYEDIGEAETDTFVIPLDGDAFICANF